MKLVLTSNVPAEDVQLSLEEIRYKPDTVGVELFIPGNGRSPGQMVRGKFSLSELIQAVEWLKNKPSTWTEEGTTPE